MEYLKIPIPIGATPRIVYGNNSITVHFDTTPAKRPLENDDAQETAGDGGVDAEPADADDAHTAKRRRKDDSKVAKVALAERLVEASDSEEDGHAEEEEGQAEEEDVDSDDDNEGDVRVKGKMARKSPNAEQLALARRLVAAPDKPAELTRIFTERYDSLPGDEHIESYRKYIFQIAKGQNSVLSLAQEIDPSIETIKMGEIPALKEHTAKKIAHQQKAEQLVQQTGKVRISDPQGLYNKLLAAAEEVIQATPSPESILLAEDLIAFSLELRQNEACPLKMRNDEHQLSSADFVIENNICTFSGGSKTHDGQPRAPFAKVCLFPNRIMLGLITHVFDNMRPKMSNGVTTAKSLAELKKHGILDHFETITKKFQRRDMRGVGSRFLIALFDDKTKACPELGAIATAQASLGHRHADTTAIYLSYPFVGETPAKIGSIAMEDDKRIVTLY